jgi:hypothetical protein
VSPPINPDVVGIAAAVVLPSYTFVFDRALIVRDAFVMLPVAVPVDTL